MESKNALSSKLRRIDTAFLINPVLTSLIKGFVNFIFFSSSKILLSENDTDYSLDDVNNFKAV